MPEVTGPATYKGVPITAPQLVDEATQKSVVVQSGYDWSMPKIDERGRLTKYGEIISQKPRQHYFNDIITAFIGATEQIEDKPHFA
ncbi:Hypothetical predicted protein [Octopus vulgaris]|uniref:Uncharacterized protein n=1 Tax=Octopus vulgaris TaxID=6645 RepID=A0AA36B7D5_OCTVU|nr:Hypothetical predicted protein [Octopus vulgaris]